jgi:hypothetical protein
MEKMTKRDYFNRILAYAHDEDKAFLEHEIELLNKKNASRPNKPTKSQVANSMLADEVYDAMQDGTSYRIADVKALVAELADANPQKVTALMTKLRKEIRVSREVVKGVAYFTKI